MRRSSLLLALVASVLTVACTDQATITENSPQFNIGNAPDESGILVRGDVAIGLTWTDQKAGTRLFVGADVVDFCNGIIQFETVSFQIATHQDGRQVRVFQGNDLTTSVWPFLPFDCALILATDPLGTGSADAVNTDNDLAGTAPDDNNANAWGFRVHGTLNRPDGSAAQLSAHLNLVFGNTTGLKVQGKINLK